MNVIRGERLKSRATLALEAFINQFLTTQNSVFHQRYSIIFRSVSVLAIKLNLHTESQL